MQTCRFCGKWDGDMVKYSVRHHAHFECFLDAGKPLESIHGWQIGQFPFRLLKARGLLEQAERLIASNHIPGRRAA